MGEIIDHGEMCFRGDYPAVVEVWIGIDKVDAGIVGTYQVYYCVERYDEETNRYDTCIEVRKVIEAQYVDEEEHEYPVDMVQLQNALNRLAVDDYYKDPDYTWAIW